MTRTYDVVALRVPIVHNGHGEHDPEGAVLALTRNESALCGIGRDHPHPLVRPLVLRACVGDRVVVHFRNELGHRAGIHPQGVRYDVGRADGGVVGANPDSAAEPGGRRRYVWDCEHEGVFFLGDLADLRGGTDGSQAHGLFGALVVEPAGATWSDPETGEPLDDGLHADVTVPGEPAFREYVTFLQDGAAGGRSLTGYRCEPRTGEHPHGSWTHGDPATPVLRAYAGDRTRIRVVHAGTGDTHVFGLHDHRWRSGAGDAPLVDTVAIGPQQAVTIEPVGGAGSERRAAGDALWLSEGRPGLWGLLRVFDVVQDGSGRYPDGTPIAALAPLPGHDPPPAPTSQRPGFPAFVAGSFPGPAPRPPSAQPVGGREPTGPERAAFCADPAPGALFTAVAPPDAPVRRYDVVALAATIHHHRGAAVGEASRRDDDGVLYVLADEIEAEGGIDAFRARTASGERAVAPLAIRAAAGEVVELTLTSALPGEPDIGLHTHLVARDPLVSGARAVGWNYHEPGHRTRTYRWYCDRELGTVALYDPDDGRRAHGLFGCLVVEPAGARWTDPHDPDREVANGEQAVVTLPDGSAFREQVLAVADGVPLVRRADGAEPERTASVAVGYRCEPLRERPGDPADWFASAVHGDPGTPLPRAYPGEPVRLRVHQGAGVRRHSLVLHGMRWRGGDNQCSIGAHQAFDLHLDPAWGPGDRLWSLAGNDDTRLGGWGLLRVHDAPSPGLPSLPSAFGSVLVPSGAVRRYHLRVRTAERDHGNGRTDPLALVYTVDGVPAGGADPLVLRARVGEWVEVTLTNELPGPPPPGPHDPPLPDGDRPACRTVSDRVSLQAAGLRYDVRESDGAFVGTNPDTTVKPGHSVTYRWFADTPGPVLLADRADVRTHRHRGLVGVLVVEPADVTPSAVDGHGTGWVGEQAVLHRPGLPAERELVLLLTDGLCLYQDGDPDRPVPDRGSGQVAINHRSAALRPDRPSLADRHPPTPLASCAPGDRLTLHLASGADRAGEDTVTVHGHCWSPEPGGPRVGAASGPSCGGVRSIALTVGEPGDYAYRTGSFRWALTDGLWGIIRVRRA